MHVWHALMGEIPSALFIILSALHIAANRYDPRTTFTGGLCAGLGCLCKLQALIGAGMLGAYLAASLFTGMRANNMPLRRILLNLLIYGIGTGGPLILFELIKIICFGSWDAYLANNAQLHTLLPVMFSFSHLDVNFQKIGVIGEYLGLFDIHKNMDFLFLARLSVLCMIFVIGIYLGFRFAIQRLSSVATSADWASNALLCCCLAHLLWYVFLCSWNMPRYLTQGMLYGCAALAIALGRKTTFDVYKGTRNALIIAFTALILRYDAVAYLWTATEYNGAFAEQQNALNILESIQRDNPGTVFFSCGYTYELEYLLPKSGNFVPCERLNDPALARHQKILVSFMVGDSKKLLYYAQNGFDEDLRYNLHSARINCPKDNLFNGSNYAIASCLN
jgi:hypothetical protein